MCESIQKILIWGNKLMWKLPSIVHGKKYVALGRIKVQICGLYNLQRECRKANEMFHL